VVGGPRWVASTSSARARGRRHRVERGGNALIGGVGNDLVGGVWQQRGGSRRWEEAPRGLGGTSSDETGAPEPLAVVAAAGQPLLVELFIILD
jgi:hypothetical protein